MHFSTITAALALVVPASTVLAGFTMSLEPNKGYQRNATASVLRAQSKYSKYLVDSVNSFSGSGVVPMTDYEYDIEYYGTVSVGTPPQKFKLDFDTGSSDLWFAGEDCTSCGDKPKFKSSESSTFEKGGKPWKISYGDGSSASGTVAYDVVDLGGLKIKKQAIELADKRSSSFNKDPIDGILGLGFNSINTVNEKTPMDNLIEQKLIDKPIFGCYLGKHKEGGGGEYIFGDINKDHIDGELKKVPIDNSQGWWGVTVDKSTVGGKEVTGNFDAILDTGTTLLILNDDLIKGIADAYGATANPDGTYTIDCDTSKFEPLKFSMAGNDFEVSPDSLVYVENGGSCIAGFASGGLSVNIIGDTFLKNNYVVYDQGTPEVQIAPSK
ncbi:e chain structures of complexes ofrhizopuspepsin with pepstatin and other statine-containinginhibitors [Lichtheimia corymbifera JMRC:FSU:9682]|uniref:rhizopuspepsin n=1 Tax=Lichtheimia corymbifera JMRC:FSU:9682 TaxID=1263082 RepID=A0A068SA77_9FUNG|nr:e chain structures of complexes ofrhizopuspepsin with pepstatin and other statine-containinginhibitors [Lichtheimia corymbifera JMRC:FSU:9682]